MLTARDFGLIVYAHYVNNYRRLGAAIFLSDLCVSSTTSTAGAQSLSFLESSSLGGSLGAAEPTVPDYFENRERMMEALSGQYSDFQGELSAEVSDEARVLAEKIVSGEMSVTEVNGIGSGGPGEFPGNFPEGELRLNCFAFAVPNVLLGSYADQFERESVFPSIGNDNSVGFGMAWTDHTTFVVYCFGRR